MIAKHILFYNYKMNCKYIISKEWLAFLSFPNHAALSFHKTFAHEGLSAGTFYWLPSPTSLCLFSPS